MQVRVEGRPVPQKRPRVTVNGTYYDRDSTAYRKALTQACWLAAKQQGWLPGYKGKCELRMVVSLVLPAKRGDASNYQKQVEDAIADAGLVANDNQIVAPAVLVLNGQATDYLWCDLRPISEASLLDRAQAWLLEVD
jgi:Holliday junction resolvase RusA-like endonuclease